MLCLLFIYYLYSIFILSRCYFKKCDGIFLNYNWTDKGLASSLALAKKEKREKDVYVGLDVWGRGCPGGGGFNSAYVRKKPTKFQNSKIYEIKRKLLGFYRL